MNAPSSRRRPLDPSPSPGLGLADFRLVNQNGFGDGHNSFAHAVYWFHDHLYVGTTRSNFHMIKIQKIFRNMQVFLWPVEGPDDEEGLYDQLDRRAQVWRYDPRRDRWEEVMRAPMVMGSKGVEVPRETGFRSMTIFQGKSDPVPALYTATWAVSRAPGARLLRSWDGLEFQPASPVGIIDGLPVTATRVLMPFRGKLFTAPTGTRGYGQKFAINVSGISMVFETDDPASGIWRSACEHGFGDPANLGIFTLAVFNEQLYAGTFNNNGFQVWRSACKGRPPYKWTKVLERGAYRGPLNQAVATFKVFKGALYAGTGIQNGGNDLNNKIGPAGSELIRIHPDDSWDLIIGTARNTPEGHKYPLSGLSAGFGNVFNGYFWSMQEHDGWLYLGTMDSTIWVRYMKPEAYSPPIQQVVGQVGTEQILKNEGGCDLWRTADGEHWACVTRNGFNNLYNLGIRNMVSTPHGLFVATANPFGPRVGVERDGQWQYVDNPRGGLEIWLGRKDWPDPAPTLPTPP